MTKFPISKAAPAASLCCALCAGAAGAATRTVLDFEGFSQSQILLGDAFSGLGVTFDGSLTIDLNGALGSLPSSGIGVAVNTAPFAGDIFGTFATPMSAVSVFAGDAGGDVDTVTLSVFDASNALVDSDTFTGVAAQTLSVFGAGIVRFEITESGLIGIDDFTFTTDTTAIPLPAALPLLLAGLGGLAAMRRPRAA